VPWRRLALAFACIVVSGVGCSREDAAEAPAAAPAVTVSTSVARVGTMVDRIASSGTVVVSRAAEFTVFAPESAVIAEIPKQEGDRVEVGDLIVRFDIASVTLAVTTAEMAVTQASGRVNTAKAEFDKLSALSSQGMVARQMVDAARNEHVDAQAALNRATGELNAAKDRLTQTEVRAKFAGVVARKWHVQGDSVIPANTDPIIRVVDETQLQVLAPVPKTDLLRLKPGQPATVAAPGAPGEPATIAQMPAVVEPDVRTADIRLSFAGPTTLRREAIVDVEIVLEQRPDLLIIPRRALQREEDVTFVMVAGDDNLAHRKPVQVGFTTRDEIQIVSGLTAGERVITTGLDQISDGSAIVVSK
jgi:RND family efflux transporter MFP subunit